MKKSIFKANFYENVVCVMMAIDFISFEANSRSLYTKTVLPNLILLSKCIDNVWTLSFIESTNERLIRYTRLKRKGSILSESWSILPLLFYGLSLAESIMEKRNLLPTPSITTLNARIYMFSGWCPKSF